MEISTQRNIFFIIGWVITFIRQFLKEYVPSTPKIVLIVLIILPLIAFGYGFLLILGESMRTETAVYASYVGTLYALLMAIWVLYMLEIIKIPKWYLDGLLDALRSMYDRVMS